VYGIDTETEDARLAYDRRSKMQDWLKIPRNNNDDENERETVMESIERSQGESVGLRSLGC
jgi:hypothetical protein